MSSLGASSADAEPKIVDFRGRLLRFRNREPGSTVLDHRDRRYLGKISGLLLDRIGIQFEVPAVRYRELRAGKLSESPKDMPERAREVQHARGSPIETRTRW